MIRVAAAGDVHFGPDSAGSLRGDFERLHENADVLLLAGDLTRHGDPQEAAVLARELRVASVPIVAVLGNHDYHLDRQSEIRGVMEDAGVTVLEGEATTLRLNGLRLGVAGTKGFGGGFADACGTDFGEPEMKAFIRHTQSLATRLRERLQDLDGDVLVALLHYAPVSETLAGERLELYPFLGSYLLGEAVDGARADVALHGHAHAGIEKGTTPGGIHVRNVAQPVIGCAYNVYCLDPRGERASHA